MDDDFVDFYTALTQAAQQHAVLTKLGLLVFKFNRCDRNRIALAMNGQHVVSCGLPVTTPIEYRSYVLSATHRFFSFLSSTINRPKRIAMTFQRESVLLGQPSISFTRETIPKTRPEADLALIPAHP